MQKRWASPRRRGGELNKSTLHAALFPKRQPQNTACRARRHQHLSRGAAGKRTKIRLRSPNTPHTPPTKTARPTSISLNPVKVSRFLSFMNWFALTLAAKESSTTPVTCITSFAARTCSRSCRLVSGFLGYPRSLYCCGFGPVETPASGFTMTPSS